MKKTEDNNKLLVENIAKVRADVEAKEQKILKSKAAPEILAALNRRINREVALRKPAEWCIDFHTALIEEAQRGFPARLCF